MNDLTEEVREIAEQKGFAQSRRELIVGEAISAYFVYSRQPDLWSQKLLGFAHQLEESPQDVLADIHGRIVHHGLKLQTNGEEHISEQQENHRLPLYLSGADFRAAYRPKEWLVDQVLLRWRLYEVYGGWKSGKTLIVSDLCLHFTLGWDWAGKKTMPCQVVYVAGEAVDEIIGRMLAFCQTHEVALEDLKHFHLRTRPTALTAKESAEMLAAEIAEFIDANLPLVLVVDTLNRNFGPGSESRDDDMTKFIGHLLDLVMRPLDATAIVVHHAGHTAKDRSRGHSSWPGALDGQYVVEKSDAGPDGRPTVAMTPTAVMRAAHDVRCLGFAIDSVELSERDNFGNPDMEPVLEFLPRYAPPIDPGSLNERTRKVLEVLIDLYGKECERMAERGQNPLMTAEVTRDMWREKCKESVIWERWNRQYFDSAVNTLKTKGFAAAIGKNFKPSGRLTYDAL